MSFSQFYKYEINLKSLGDYDNRRIFAHTVTTKLVKMSTTTTRTGTIGLGDGDEYLGIDYEYSEHGDIKLTHEGEDISSLIEFLDGWEALIEKIEEDIQNQNEYFENGHDGERI